MKAMILKKVAPIEEEPLKLEEIPAPQPGPKQILVKISTCGICHTELDEIEGRLQPSLPIILGHEIVGRVESLGPKAAKFKLEDRVGIAWINSACGKCDFCRRGNENLCPDFLGTGCNANGGYSEYTVVSEDFAYPIPDGFSDSTAAPLLCAGSIGYRALKLTGLHDGQILGLFGFGASAHIVIQIAKHKYPNCKVFVFTRPKQKDHQELATKLGADWVGATGETPPEKPNCAIDFTPVWNPVVEAMKVMEKGGRLVINAIRKEERDKDSLLKLDYPAHLWLEKEIKSVANITRADAEEFLPLAAEIPIAPQIQEFKLEEANKALILLKQGKIQGAGVLKISE
ncbi:MAG: zinc-binding alcohol dehydrogenase family protein [Phycisphaerae bacterium]|nr:zinc-dependent alcohol dehydrogenase family protein [Phycisphaerae bacterium]NIP56004.1 zinc-dependent alcohol dehydrogenase family protein [Phycisphaerae bacterium]NIS54568.1 zinc-dependent alcohol dehydrogenase family protein [Phycisphaerae bacterium]NIU10551.1 zinc-dependent alcohol dehydrogenase family protein [Phycisphaerae bacterium]NIU60012.1 zinc-binding alcohol dehydrogenase family protein [Phycisphaerae bacterium]